MRKLKLREINFSSVSLLVNGELDQHYDVLPAFVRSPCVEGFPIYTVIVITQMLLEVQTYGETKLMDQFPRAWHGPRIPGG